MTFRKPKKGRPVVATPYLHCAGLGNRLGHSDEDALEMLNRILDAADCNLSDASMTDERDSNNSNDYSVLGVGERIPFRLTPAQIHLVEGASYIFLEFASLAHSAQALEVLERSTVLDSATSASGHRTERHLRVSYAEVRAPVSPADGVRCTSRYSVAKPQGLMLWPDVISEEDEKTLLAVIDALPWDESTLARRVQHYGYTFQYGFRSIDFLNNAPSMPECFHDLVCFRYIFTQVANLLDRTLLRFQISFFPGAQTFLVCRAYLRRLLP
jgi:hypothetical protein